MTPIVYKDSEYEIEVGKDDQYTVWHYYPDGYETYGKVWFYICKSPTVDSAMVTMENHRKEYSKVA